MACHPVLAENHVIFFRIGVFGVLDDHRSYNTPENLGIFAAETLHICLETRTMRRLLGPARDKACLPLIDITTEK